MVIKAVIFDIGGVVVGSPVVGVSVYEAKRGLPPDYLNHAITARGHNGAFQRLERSELGVREFYRLFGEELSDHQAGNKAYRALCEKRGIPCPTLPSKDLGINGEQLWGLMMAKASEPDPIVIRAINRLRRNPNLKIAALTNNFVDKEAEGGSFLSSDSATVKPRARDEVLSVDELDAAYRKSKATGAHALKSLFDHYIESAIVGMRKPDPRFYQHALALIGVKAEEAVFLDDIGLNLVAARKLGINTIRVYPGRALEAVKELEGHVNMDLQSPVAVDVKSHL